MAIDTNPFANGQQQPQQQDSMSPSRLNNGTMTGGAAAMIKALMDGNDAYKQRMAAGGRNAGTGDGQWFGNSSVGGAPLSGYSGVAPDMPAPIVQPTSPAAMQGGAPLPMPRPAFDAGAAPMNIDPMTQALFSPIPGADGGQFGG